MDNAQQLAPLVRLLLRTMFVTFVNLDTLLYIFDHYLIATDAPDFQVSSLSSREQHTHTHTYESSPSTLRVVKLDSMVPIRLLLVFILYALCAGAVHADRDRRLHCAGVLAVRRSGARRAGAGVGRHWRLARGLRETKSLGRPKQPAASSAQLRVGERYANCKPGLLTAAATAAFGRTCG